MVCHSGVIFLLLPVLLTDIPNAKGSEEESHHQVQCRRPATCGDHFDHLVPTGAFCVCQLSLPAQPAIRSQHPDKARCLPAIVPDEHPTVHQADL